MPNPTLFESFFQYHANAPQEKFFEALAKWAGYTTIYGRRKDQAVEELTKIDESQFPNKD